MAENTTLARVTSVKTKRGRVFVDVEEARPGVGQDGIPFATLAPGMMITPEEGYWVEIYKTEDGKQARFPHSSPLYQMPDIPESSFVYKLDEDTEISAIKQEDGTYDITINASSDSTINIDGGQINLGKDGQGVITDIETSTDSEGNVTGISVTRSNKINVE